MKSHTDPDYAAAVYAFDVVHRGVKANKPEAEIVADGIAALERASAANIARAAKATNPNLVRYDSTHGRCKPCGVIFKWRGAPLLREAACPRCGQPLSRTAAALLSRAARETICNGGVGPMRRTDVEAARAARNGGAK